MMAPLAKSPWRPFPAHCRNEHALEYFHGRTWVSSMRVRKLVFSWRPLTSLAVYCLG
jgi:hypothetical protein